MPCAIVSYPPTGGDVTIREIYPTWEEAREKIKTRCDECNIGGCHGIIDADQDQRDQLTTRLSLRREK